MDQSKLKELAIQLFDLKAFKFYECKTKEPFYFDQEVIMSNPHIMSTVSDLISEYMKLIKVGTEVYLYDAPCTATPVASLVSAKAGNTVLIRKECKTYGSKPLIEANFSTGDKCLIIANEVYSGIAVRDAAKVLRANGLVVTDAIVVVDREQGGIKNMKKMDIRIHSLFSLSFLLNTLREAGRIKENTALAVSKYAEANQIDLPVYDESDQHHEDMSYKIATFSLGLGYLFHCFCFLYKIMNYPNWLLR